MKTKIPNFEGIEEMSAEKCINQEEQAYDVTELDKIIEDASFILANNNQNINKWNLL